VLKVARLEVKKSRKKYGRFSVLAVILAIFFSASLSYYSFISGTDSENGLYTIKSKFPIYNPKFVRGDDYDVYLGDGYILVKNTDKSIAAAEELLNYLKQIYNDYISKEYGDKAFPLLVRVEYIPTPEPSPSPSPEPTEVSEQTPVKESEKPAPVATPESEKEKKEEKTLEGETEDYVLPDEIEAPSLLEKLIVAFIFVIPSYFTVQIFSSSFLEDKLSRRLEVLLSATNSLSITYGKLIPYFLASLFITFSISAAFGKPFAFVFVIPVVFFLFSAQAFIIMLSRSYREATFLLLVTSLLITIYVFIPAVFSGSIPVSKISPVTLMLNYLEGLDVGLDEALLSFSHLLLMSFVLFYLSAKSLNPEISYHRSILGKMLLLAESVITKPWHSFLFAVLSIPFALMAEFFLIIILFVLPPDLAIPALILAVALVEEMLKGVIISAKPDLQNATLTALGFFTGEKLLLLFALSREYSIAFLGQYLFLPLILHVATALLFIYTYRFGFRSALMSASTLHFTYNYAVVMLLVY
jgi:ABC-type Na+ efflux pump permease subunit